MSRNAHLSFTARSATWAALREFATHTPQPAGIPVTGRVGSVHPIGQPIIQSEKFGLKVRSPTDNLGPAVKLMWSRRVEGS